MLCACSVWCGNGCCNTHCNFHRNARAVGAMTFLPAGTQRVKLPSPFSAFLWCYTAAMLTEPSSPSPIFSRKKKEFSPRPQPSQHKQQHKTVDIHCRAHPGLTPSNRRALDTPSPPFSAKGARCTCPSACLQECQYMLARIPVHDRGYSSESLQCSGTTPP